MSERKVLNKYYPPTFDPSKIPKVKGPKNRTFSIRVMAPFNMRCDTCGVYIYKGKKFNSRKENVDDEFYYGLRIFRFYIKCPCCVAEIAFKTDLKNTDYTLEAGATRLFEAEKLAKQMAEKEQKEKDDEDLNPMKVLENRTKASRNEIEQLDTLEELRELNTRNAAVDHANMIALHSAYEDNLQRLQDEEDERMVQSIFGKKDGMTVKRLADSDSDDYEDSMSPPVPKKQNISEKSEKPTDILAETPKEPKKLESWQKSVGTLSSVQSKKGLAGLIVKKKPKVETVSSNSVIHSKTNGESNSSNSVTNNQSQTSLQTTSASDHQSGTQKLEPSQSNITIPKSEINNKNQAGTSNPGFGLGMLGSYSDSDDTD